MNLDQNRLFLKNIVDRIERDPSSGKLKLSGVISENEFTALCYAAGLPSSNLKESEDINPARTEFDVTVGTTKIIYQTEANRASNVILDLSVLSSEPSKSLMLCLDFGTAYSKASATFGEDVDLLELELGREAGESNRIYQVSSTLYITKGRVWFGPDALRLSDEEQSPQRRRLDSPKQEISRGDFANLDRQLVGKDLNPTDTAFTLSDLILLYLGYLTDLSCSQLVKLGHSRHTRRRFARPAWQAEQDAWANDWFQAMLARAQIVADTLSNQWRDGIDVARAREILDRLGEFDEKPVRDLLIEGPILEAVAAANSALRRGPSGRKLYVIIDVGAGTSDFGVFLVVSRADGEVRVSAVKQANKVLRQAGDTVDQALFSFILVKEGLLRGSAEERQLTWRLQRQIRQQKEALFITGGCTYQLTDDRIGRVELDDFLSSQNTQGFSQALEREFLACLESVHESFFVGAPSQIEVVLTGGGSNLPMVKALASSAHNVHGRTIKCVETQVSPPWIRERYENLVPFFPQLAVSIGGAASEVPVELSSYSTFAGDAPSGPRYIPIVYKS